jgi:hypothetical protein
VKYRISFHEH